MKDDSKDPNSGVETPASLPPLETADKPVAAPAVTAWQPGQPKTRPEHHRRHKPLQALFLVLLIAIVGFGGGYLGGKASNSNTDPVTQRVVLDQQDNLVSTISREVGPSVVSVNVTGQATTGPSLFGFGGRQIEQQSAGTGVIIDDDGLIITNRHVVPAGTTDVSITLADGTELDDVEVVARTSETDSLDIAFLRVTDAEGEDLPVAKLGKSGDMRVGQSVVAIGNALGQFQNSVTTGIISGYGRSVQAASGDGLGAESLVDLFQTDAAINQGNSGGPLVNLSGEVIGINTAVADEAENVGFAIPIDNVSGLIESVRETGRLERPYLGIQYVALTDALAEEFELSTDRGAYIPSTEEFGSDTVIDGAPAEQAGIKEGDIITKVDGTALSNNVSLTSLLGRHQPGDKISLTVSRGGNNQAIDVTLGTLPGSAG